MCALPTAAVLLAAAMAVPAPAQTVPAPQAAAPQAAEPLAGGGYGARGGPPSPELRAALHAVREQCEADVVRLCPDPHPDGAPVDETKPPSPPTRRNRAIYQCVRQHADSFTPGCRQAIESARALRRSARPAPEAGLSAPEN